MAPEPDDYAVSLTEEEQRSLRGSKFAPLPAPPTSSRSLPRLVRRYITNSNSALLEENLSTVNAHRSYLNPLTLFF